MVKYVYDAWGNQKIVDNNGNKVVGTNHIGNLNPFRYRSYYYDIETNLYFLKTRYYDPEICRFITIDDLKYLRPDTINGINLYAYCRNNPVNMYDCCGNFARFLRALYESIEIEFGVGVGVGFSISCGLFGIEMMYVYKDIIEADDGHTGIGCATEINMSITVAFIEFGITESSSHYFDDPDCVCDPILSPFLDKATCPANEFQSSYFDVKLSLSLGIYLGGGGQISGAFNLSEFVQRMRAWY